MRTRRREAEPELSEWQKAGWTEAPRNGREWKTLRAGKPQPERRQSAKKCRSCGSTDRSLRSLNGGLVPYCVPCRAKSNKKANAKPRSRAARARWAAKKAAEARTTPIERPSRGFALLDIVTFRLRQKEVHDRLFSGEVFAVELFGDVSYYLVPARVFEESELYRETR